MTVGLNAAEILNQPVSEGKPRVTLRIKVPDRTVTADIAAKSLRKAQTTIRENGVKSTVCILQSKLITSDEISEAGLSAHPKVKAEAPTVDNHSNQP